MFTDLGQCPVSMPFEQPSAVVAVDERSDLAPRLLDVLEVMEVEAFLLQRPHEALSDAVAFGLAHVAGGGRNLSIPMRQAAVRYW